MGLTEKGVAKARRGALDWQLDGRRKRERGKNNGKKDKKEVKEEERRRKVKQQTYLQDFPSSAAK